MSEEDFTKLITNDGEISIEEAEKNFMLNTILRKMH